MANGMRSVHTSSESDPRMQRHVLHALFAAVALVACGPPVGPKGERTLFENAEPVPD